MTWDIIARLIIVSGISLAEKISQKWAAGQPPTAADWAELRAAEADDAKAQMLKAMARAGLDASSAQGKAFLALTP